MAKALGMRVVGMRRSRADAAASAAADEIVHPSELRHDPEPHVVASAE